MLTFISCDFASITTGHQGIRNYEHGEILLIYYYYLPTKMTKINQMLVRVWCTQNSHTLLVFFRAAILRTVWQFLIKLNMYLLYNPAAPLLVCTQENISTQILVLNICSSFICNNLKLEVSPMFMNQNIIRLDIGQFYLLFFLILPGGKENYFFPSRFFGQSNN